MRRRRRKKEQENEDGDRWILTYSDMITLLLVFFIVLYSMSKINQSKFNSLIKSLRNAFHVGIVQTKPSNTMSLDVPKKSKTLVKKLKKKKSQTKGQKPNKLYPKLMNYVKTHHLETKTSLANLSGGVQITIQGDILFALGKAKIRNQAERVLHEVGGFLKTVNNPIVIKGYTDNLPIHTAQFQSNWELSVARANSVRIFLQNKVGVKPSRMRIVGFGKYHPRVPNDSKANRAENRRVNIVILRRGNRLKEAGNIGS